MTHLLGIDLGTSSVKVAIIDSQSLRALAVNTVEYPVYHPQSGFAEQDPADWWTATSKAVQSVIEETPGAEIAAIGLSGQMHGLVCLDSQLEPVQDAIIWADTRSTDEVQDLKAQQAQFTSTLPGLPAVGFAASSALWLKNHQPQILEKTQVWCLPKDYIILKLTGNISTEPSDAASTWLYDIQAQSWAEDVYTYCGLSASQMPPVIASSDIAGNLTPDCADSLGLPAGIPVVAGSADLPAQGVGQGITSPETLLVTVGTGGQIFVPTDKPVVDENHRYYLLNHNLADTWYVQAAMLSAGMALRWLRDTLGMENVENAYEQLSSMASEIPAGADGLLFLPYLTGERSPHMDSQASGIFFGLRLHHTPAHLARAVMEGVAFAVRDCLSYIPREAVKRYVLSGGITQSPVWTQILADILGESLYIGNDDRPYGVIGAAILAGLGAGVYPDITAVNTLRDDTHTAITPNPSEIYDTRFEQYRRLYPLLKEEMHQLSS